MQPMRPWPLSRAAAAAHRGLPSSCNQCAGSCSVGRQQQLVQGRQLFEQGLHLGILRADSFRRLLRCPLSISVNPSPLRLLLRCWLAGLEAGLSGYLILSSRSCSAASTSAVSRGARRFVVRAGTRGRAGRRRLLGGLRGCRLRQCDLGGQDEAGSLHGRRCLLLQHARAPVLQEGLHVLLRPGAPLGNLLDRQGHSGLLQQLLGDRQLGHDPDAADRN
mmetsp:Transcript_58366/g.156193  ORF Transcript_58366/g.156193 Transcript_58366/m.156193 type:complete len:219 (-) Transcript_58366:549-1205(-)